MKTILKILLFFFLNILFGCSSENDDTLTTNNYTTVENLLTKINFQGYAIVTKNGNDLVRKGFGLANKNTLMPHNFDMQYRIGSVSKTLTSAAIVQLKRDGLINNFNQTLNEFDNKFPKGNQITIAHLLSHQSGIPAYQLIVEKAYEQGKKLDEQDIYEVITKMISENGLNFTPGSNKQYVNSNFLIAALLVQKLSGMTYQQYLKEKVFNPLKMNNTYKGTNIINTNTHAQGYKNDTTNSTYPMVISFGAGDFSSTPKDMEKWVNSVKTDWFTEIEKEEIFITNVPNGYVDFGLGWVTSQKENTTMYWHGGDINGYWSMIAFIPKYNATIVLLSNQQSDKKGTQRNTIIQQLLTQEFN